MDEKQKSGVSFTDLLVFLKNKIWVILIALVVFAMSGFIFTKFMVEPKYTATAGIYVINDTPDDSTVTRPDMQLSQNLISDYKVLITTPNVLKRVQEELELDMSQGQLASMINVTTHKDSRVLKINVEDTNPERATKIANCVWQVAAEELIKIMDVTEVNNVYEATVPTSPSSPNVPLNTIISALIGLVLAIVVLTFIFIFDSKITKEEEVTYYLGLPTLGTIPYTKEIDEDYQRKIAAKDLKQKKEKVEKLGE